MTTIPFVKMHGAGNDFVVVDHRERFLPSGQAARALFAAMCDRRRGVGADGVLLLERADSADFAMRYFNSDGGHADFCGNGARCIARFALDLGLGAQDVVSFETAVGTKSARLLHDAPEAGRIELVFGPVDAAEPRTVNACGRDFAGRFVVTGVPHFVVGVPDVGAVEFATWSPALRGHASFGASGANVDWVARGADGRVEMRTWERGVEDETLACGSGAIATALWAVAEGASSPVTVRTAGGDDLVVAFTETPQGRLATLTGPAVVVFGGAWPLD